MAQPLRKEEHYTYEDFCTWDDGERWELIDGIAYMMAAPLRVHQEISGNLHFQLYDFLKNKPCKVYAAPIDVRLNADGADDTVLQPDIAVVCDRSKLDDKGITGAPDMVIEILSPSTASYDRTLKFDQYLRAGVREYWIADPDSKTVSAHILENGRYYVTAYGENDAAPVHVLEGCRIALRDVFAD